MIKSILDTDLYKFSTSYAYFSKYPLAEGTFTFTDRNKQKWSADQQRLFGELFKYELYRISELKLTGMEQMWCKQNVPYIPAPYWEWLSGFQFNPMAVEWDFDEDGVFHCEVTDALYKVTLYEIMVLATYAELRNLVMGVVPDWEGARKRTIEKINKANAGGVVFSEFGTRRRFSTDMQEMVISLIKEGSKTCLGTSNVYLAMKYGMKPIGTFPHEWVMMHAACFGYKRANFLSLEDWIKVYKGDLGIALVDTYTTKSFLHTLTKQQAILLQGFRQDSGDERVVGNMIIDRLKELGIDPKTKTIVFSNALDMDKACNIADMFRDRCKPSFGIGTNLTCDVQVEGYKPANIVMKLSRCRLSFKDNWEPCLKISDDQGKHMGSEEEFQIACRELDLDLNN